MARRPRPRCKEIESLIHEEARRRNIPTAELQSFYEREAPAKPVTVGYPRATPLAPGERRERNPDLDPQLVWRGKDEQDWSDLVVHAPPLYIQEKVHPKAIIEDLRRQSTRRREEAEAASDLFADFNDLPDAEAKLEFYAHDQNWSNRMILGDSLQVMASLAGREGLRGQVQCIYIDPPYGIKFNSNFQWSTTSRDVKDGSAAHVTREPEQIKAFRDTWKDGIHSYLTYLRDRLTVAHDLLDERGSAFVQIGDENAHRVRALMDQVFGANNFCAVLGFKKTGGQTSKLLSSVCDFLIWYAKDIDAVKFNRTYLSKQRRGTGSGEYSWIDIPDKDRRRLTKRESDELDPIPSGSRFFIPDNLTSNRPPGDFPVPFLGKQYRPKRGFWKTSALGMKRLVASNRLLLQGQTLRYVRFFSDFPVSPVANVWEDTAARGWGEEKSYVVQTGQKVVERCVLMTTDPGDLVLDPTCGSGTTAYVAEQWGRRWITIDTSRVALALARARIMGARYPYYLLADTEDGRQKEAEITGKVPADGPTYGDIRQGFVYERVPHITLKSIANNAEIDVIYEQWQETLEPLREALNEALGESWEEWQIPRETNQSWAPNAKNLHARWWEARAARQKEIDASIARNADVELLYDRPYEDKGKVRVAGPFTVESLSPHRVIATDEGETFDEIEAVEGSRRRKVKLPYERDGGTDFAEVVLDHLRAAGVQQRDRDDRITFTSLSPWPGEYVGAEGRYMEGDVEKRAAILIGPEFGTLARPDLVAAAREAVDARFDVLIACAFAYDAHASDFSRLGALMVLRARMNPDLHMADELKNTGAGNLFVVFGEPDIEVREVDGDQIEVQVLGVDVFNTATGEVRSGGTEDIAAWFIDTDYDEESFFVRHAYFLGAHDPYKALKTTLKAEIDEEAWATLYRDTSRPFARPSTKRFAVKVINHLGDEVMKVFSVQGRA
jgi:adenine-specific DNA-methyltransferase